MNRFPRVRGDVPVVEISRLGRPRFSPRARGCSALDKARLEANKVFPACAGMFLVFI